MHEISNAYLHFEPPGADPVGGILIQGWLVPKPGAHFADIRALAGGRIFPGVLGIPRQDLAEFFKSHRTYLLAGFTLRLDLPVGRHQLTIEGLGLDGCWQFLETLERECLAPVQLSPGQEPAPLAAGIEAELFRLLLRRMSDPGVAPGEAAVALLDETPAQHHLRYPHRPFHGHLDQPRIRTQSIYGRAPVSGWIFHETLPIKRVFATVDLQAAQNLRMGRATAFLQDRPFTAELITHCGYDGFVDLPAQLPQPVSVRVYAELSDGSWHLGSVARFAASDLESRKRPYVSFSPLAFWRGGRALTRAFQSSHRRRLGLAPRWPAIREVWSDYASEAPRPVVRQRPGRATAGEGGRDVHLFTHNLDHEGAPLFLVEYARQLPRPAGGKLVVTSAREGPLRRQFETLGATVQIADLAAVTGAANAADHRRALRALAGQIDLTTAGLVVANTLSCYWAVHLADAAGRPVLFYIHESTSPRAFFHGHLPGDAVAAVEEAFRLADRVSFLTASTRHYYAALSAGANYGLLPGWIDLAGIDRFRAGYSREAMRTRLGLAPGQKLVVNLGTVCERKGQHLFARAVDLLAQRAPELAAATVFLMVGGRDTSYDRELQDFLGTLGHANLRVVPGTGEVYPYFGAADLFVCSSYEESFPRVILEAMAFSLPILSTAVHGIPEIVRDGTEAVLVPAGDSLAMAAALQRLLEHPEAGLALGRQARTRVAAEFDSRLVLPRHVALAQSLRPTQEGADVTSP
jgi:glycosyltransferase involved in cell wall biosynthesis